MAKLIHVGEMLGISDDDAVAVMKDISASVVAHLLMSDVVGELVVKYDKKSILVGMMLAKVFEANDISAREFEAKKPNFDFGHG